MREIKFRAWIKDPKEMVYYDKLMLFNGSDEAIAFHKLETSYIDDYEVKTPFELMQYTGLLDCNGKEIYEGDIVKWGVNILPISFGWGDDNECYGSSYGWLLGSGIFGSDQTFSSEVEVIGNIYENPELLEAKKNEGPGIL